MFQYILFSSTRFRWTQRETTGSAPGWGLDDIYIGEVCPDMCMGRGDCYQGKCHCDPGYKGDFSKYHRFP